MEKLPIFLYLFSWMYFVEVTRYKLSLLRTTGIKFLQSPAKVFILLLFVLKYQIPGTRHSYKCCFAAAVAHIKSSKSFNMARSFYARRSMERQSPMLFAVQDRHPLLVRYTSTAFVLNQGCGGC